LTVSNVKLSGAPASEFVLLNACGEVVAPGGSCTITVAFAPTTAGADAETLSLQWISGGNTATVTVALAGTGIATSATLSATALNFAGQPVGTVSPPQVVTFSNPGPVPLTLTAITIYGVNPGDLPAAYSQTNNCGYALPPNQTCQISVSFAPSIIGTANATLGILSGSATVGTVALSGSGVTGPLVSTVAGFGQARWADGTGRNAYFNGPKGIAVDAQGNVYVADTGNHVIRKVIPAAGVVTTLAGVPGVAGAANGAGATASFSSPIGIAVDALGNVYVADTGNNLIRKLTVSGASVVVSTLAGTGVAGYTDSPALATDGSSAAFNAPSGIAVDAVGNVYVADAANAVIRRVLPTGVTSTFAGSGQVGWVDGIGANASFGAPYALALDGQGHLWVADQGPNNSVRAVALATRAVTSVTRQQSFGSSPAGLAVSVGGVVYSYFNCGIDTVSAAGFSPIDASFGQCGYRDGALASALFAGTSDALVMDASGNLYVADTGNHVIRVIAPLP
jgi:sugar lactone lactonase YvrE